LPKNAACCVRGDQAGVDGEAFTTNQALGHRAPHHHLEQAADHVAVAEAAMTGLGEARMVGNATL
jgi:hypothetical protein